MHHSKYNPKYDPKYSSNRHETAAPVVQAPAATLAGNVGPAQATAAPQITTQSHEQVVMDANHQEMKSDSQDAPVAKEVDAPISEQDMDAPTSDSRQPIADKTVHAVREPSALTGGLPEPPVAKTSRETGENPPGPSGKTVS